VAEAGSVTIENLAEFRRALREAVDASPRELAAGLRKAGVPIIAQARGRVPHVTGRLASSYVVAIRGSDAWVRSKVPYGAGAEWGLGGHWAGFRRYGGRGRFVARALDDEAEQVFTILTAALNDLIDLHGWAS